MFINWLNDVVAERAYSRKLEEEADAVGLEIMAMAGYDPRAMADLWELMGCVEHDAELEGTTRTLDSRVPFLRSHPTSVERYDVSYCDPNVQLTFAGYQPPHAQGHGALEQAPHQSCPPHARA